MKNIKTVITRVGSIALLSTSTFIHAADDASLTVSDSERLHHETTGVIGGAVVGGILGGPVGAVVTAAFGSWVSDKTLAKKENILLAAALDQRQQEMIALRAEYRALEARYQVTARESRATQLRNASFEAIELQNTQRSSNTDCCADAELSLHFKTNSIQVEALYEEKLREFAALVKSLPAPVIAITGHADRRGDYSANLALSQKRVQAVEEKLHVMGINGINLQTSAYGEEQPASAEDSLENNFFDRRVVVKVLSAGKGYLTRSNE